jgi:Leucine-rich repeat (LRR) protein
MTSTALAYWTDLHAALRKPAAVRELDLSGQDWAELPAEVTRLQHLESLNLSRNPRLSPAAVAEFMPHWPGLERLYWMNAELSALPEALGDLRRLQHLHVDNNQLSALPDRLGDLPALMNLSADHNRLAELPPGMSRLQSLRLLSLRYNAFSTVPPVLFELRGLLSCQFAGNIGKKKRQALTPRFAEQFTLYSL